MQDVATSQSLGDFTPFDIDALPFNPTTGTLEDVTVQLIGSHTPETANDLGPSPATTTLSTRVFVFATNGGSTLNMSLGARSGIPVTFSSPGAAGIATGAATPVNAIFDLSDLAAFETGIAGPQLLLEYGFRTSNTLSGMGGASDLTSFSGQAILTYDYTAPVPEPLALALPGAGLAGIAMVRDRR